MVATIISYFTHFSYFTIDRFHHPHLARVPENERRDRCFQPTVILAFRSMVHLITRKPADICSQVSRVRSALKAGLAACEHCLNELQYCGTAGSFSLYLFFVFFRLQFPMKGCTLAYRSFEGRMGLKPTGTSVAKKAVDDRTRGVRRGGLNRGF